MSIERRSTSSAVRYKCTRYAERSRNDRCSRPELRERVSLIPREIYVRVDTCPSLSLLGNAIICERAYFFPGISYRRGMPWFAIVPSSTPSFSRVTYQRRLRYRRGLPKDYPLAGRIDAVLPCVQITDNARYHPRHGVGFSYGANLRRCTRGRFTPRESAREFFTVRSLHRGRSSVDSVAGIYIP